MKVIYGLGKEIGAFDRPCVALGIFDGLHLGHQYVLKSMAKYAISHNRKAVCITFFPHPLKILSSKNIFVHLISLTHRINLIKQLGLDVCIVINFDRKFLHISPRGFIDILRKKVNPSVIFVGSNFTFGKGGAGNIKLLKNLAKKYDFKVKEITPLRLDGKIISSTLVRSLIKEGELNSARRYLGRNVFVLGKVVKGRRVGRKLGYHTANIDTEHEVIPPPGIYAVKVRINPALFYSESQTGVKRRGIKDIQFFAAAYIGTSPTMHFRYRLSRLEVYILNFNKNIYGERIEVEFIKKIREEIKFDSLVDLREQIKKDIVRVQSILSRTF